MCTGVIHLTIKCYTKSTYLHVGRELSIRFSYNSPDTFQMSRDQPLEVGDQVVVVEIMGSGQRSILRCEAANTAAGTSTILAK